MIIELGKGYQTTIDDSDFDKIKNYKWRVFKPKLNKTVYVRSSCNKKVLLHRLIMNSSKGVIIDHKDGNGLNNTRENLREVTHDQNMSNRQTKCKTNKSGYRGVSFESRREKWVSYISKGKSIFLGYFNNKEEAARAYDKKAKELFGEFCGKLNFKENNNVLL